MISGLGGWEIDKQPPPTHRYILKSNSIQPCLSSESTSVEYQQGRYSSLHLNIPTCRIRTEDSAQRLSQIMQAKHCLQSTLGKVSTDRQKDIRIVGGEEKKYIISVFGQDRRGILKATSTNSDPRERKP